MATAASLDDDDFAGETHWMMARVYRLSFDFGLFFWGALVYRMWREGG